MLQGDRAAARALQGPRNPWLASARYLRDPFRTLLDAAARYGDPFVWPSFLGRVVVTGDPVGIRDILTADPTVFTALGAELLAPVLGASNLILLGGEPHRWMRRFYGPRLHGEALRDYGAVIVRVAREHAARWPARRAFAVEDTMRAIALDVILEVVLGLADPGPRRAFRHAVQRLVRALKPSFLFIPALRRPLLGLSAWARFRRRAAEVTSLFEQEVRARRHDGARHDLLSALIAAQKDDGESFGAEEIMEQMVSLIGAGHETTASALTWALWHIHRDPAVKERLLDELQGLGDELDPGAVAQLPFLDAVCSETLRLNPVAPLTGRALSAPLVVKGCTVPAGAAVGISIVGLHRRAELYPEPDHFRPERFLQRAYGPFELLPFGGGSRRCLGASFAIFEMKLVLAAVLRVHRLRLVTDGDIGATLRNTTAGPARAIRFVCER